MKSPIELLVSLLEDSKRLNPGVQKTDRDIITARARFEYEGLGFLTKTLPSLCDAFDEGLASGRMTCPAFFKKKKGGVLPAFLSGFLCLIFDPITGVAKENVDLPAVKTVREILRFFKKMRLDKGQEEDLDLQSKRKFFDLELSIPDPDSLDQTLGNIVDHVSGLVLGGLDLFRPSYDLTPRHGPGAVAEGLTPNQKWVGIRKLISRLNDAIETNLFDGPLFLESPSSFSTSDCAKLVSVPKDSKSRRTITVEPLLNQFVQQGLNSFLRDIIKEDPVLRLCLHLTDQSQNSILALEGSRTDEWSTIDLSSASDLLSCDIVSRVFKRHEVFYEYLMKYRTPSVKDGNVAIPLKKFAGMGNATTFPVQSVVFAVIAISAVLITENKSLSFGSVVRAARDIRVYGDDIIIRRRYAHQVARCLTACGLKVNDRKSFLSGNFKESCGVDAYCGEDVTPLYLRIDPRDVSKRDPSSIAHFVSLSNQAWFRGLYAVSELLKAHVESILRKKLPYVALDSSRLGLHTRQNISEVHRWNSELCRFELRAYGLETKFRPDPIDGYEALMKFLFKKNYGENPETWDLGYLQPSVEDPKHLMRSPVRFKSRIAQRWVPA